jgi:hypothetical protein
MTKTSRKASRSLRPWRKTVVAARRFVTNNAAATAATSTKNQTACYDSQIKINGAAIRKAKFEGRDHLIAPVVAVKEAVLNGHLVLYDEFSAYPSAWEGVPLPIYHPEKNRQRVTANSPDILESQVVGRMFNVMCDDTDKALKGELWIDIVKAQASNDGKEIIRRLEAGEVLEVSTGYFSDLELTAGFHNGVRYDAIQRNMRPDHLALLPDKKGACSWTDGCGAPRLNQQQPAANNVKYLVTEKGGGTHMPVTDNAGNADHRLMGAAWAALHGGYRGNQYTGPGKQKAIAKLKAMYKKEKMATPAGNAFEDPATVFHFQTNQDDFSHDDIASMIREELSEEEPNCYYYLSDVFDTYFVYVAESKNYVPPPASPAGMFKRDYTVSDGGVALGNAQPVIRKTTYVPEVEPENNSHRENLMKKEEIVTKLIAGGTWKEGDRALLMAANEKDLERFLPVDNAAAAAATAKKTAVDKLITHSATTWKEEHRAVLMSLNQAELDVMLPKEAAPAAAAATDKVYANADDFLKTLPADLRAVFQSGMTENQRKKSQLVQAMVGQQSCRFSKEELEGMELTFLEKVADSMNVSFVGRALPRGNDRARVNNDADDGVPNPPKFMTAPLAPLTETKK